MDSKLFDLIRPVTDYIDSGRFFRQPLQWLYYALGVLCGLFPFFVIYQMTEMSVFRYAEGSEMFALILVLIGLFAVSFVCFLLWFNRAEKLPQLVAPDSKFVAVPVVANLIQTLGEVYGIFIGVFGCFCSVILTLFDFYMPLPMFRESGIAAILLLPIAGYIIVVASRYLAELVLSIADIANNTDKISKYSNITDSK